MEDHNATIVSEITEQPQYHWNNRLVLITEDEEVNFFYLKTLLKKTEARIIRARNGKEAIDIITDHHGDLPHGVKDEILLKLVETRDKWGCY